MRTKSYKDTAKEFVGSYDGYNVWGNGNLCEVVEEEGRYRIQLPLPPSSQRVAYPAWECSVWHLVTNIIEKADYFGLSHRMVYWNDYAIVEIVK